MLFGESMIKNLYRLFFVFMYINFFSAHALNNDILLIIHYNHPYYSSAGFLKELYLPYCPNIVFFGDGNREELRVEGIKIQEIATDSGRLFSRVMSKVFEQYPSFRGYLFLQDDCLLNYWQFTHLNKDKIWFALFFNESKEPFFSSINLITNEIFIRPWEGWHIHSLLENTKKAYSTMPKKFLNKIQKTLGADRAVTQVCDMFYIPGRHTEKALELSNQFKDVFCEIAVPMTLCALDPIKKWEQLSMRWGAASLENYPYHLSWIHPIKLSHLDTRKKVKEIFKQGNTYNIIGINP